MSSKLEPGLGGVLLSCFGVCDFSRLDLGLAPVLDCGLSSPEPGLELPRELESESSSVTYFRGRASCPRKLYFFFADSFKTSLSRRPL